MDSTVLMAAWQNLPDPGLMPPQERQGNEREAKTSSAGVSNRIPTEPNYHGSRVMSTQTK